MKPPRQHWSATLWFLPLALTCFAAQVHAEDYPGANDAAANKAKALDVPASLIEVKRDGDKFYVSIDVHIDVAPKTAWQVLTDFPRMVKIIPDLQVSKVKAGADAQHFTVQQSGLARFGPFTQNYDSTREVELVPYERITAHNIAGNVKGMHSVLILSGDHGGTRLVYHADVEPGFWIPPLVGPAAVKGQTAEQFSALVREMKRREVAGAQ